jgi:hypothetical protein
MRKTLVVAVGGFLMTVPAQATTFYGYTAEPNGVTSGAALDARNSFISSLASFSTESFESFGMAQTPLALSFQGSAGQSSATLSGVGNTDANRGNTFATTGSKEFIAYGSTTIDFATAVSAFGFYATDVADLGRGLTVLINGGSGGVFDLLSGSAGANGNLLFFGVTSATPISSITFAGAGQNDGFGFDDLTVGQAAAAVPEPATWAMFIGGFGLIGGAMRRRQRVAVRFA